MKRVIRCNIFISTILILVAALVVVSPTKAVPATEFNIEVSPALSVSMSNVNLEATVGTLATGTGALSISSNNATGYNTFITSSSTETALMDLSEEYQIPSITTTITAANFPTNAWGMSVDGTNYDGITPLDSTTPAISTLSPSTPSTITQNISFATKVDATTPAGTYSNSILVTVVPNYVPITLTESYNLAGKTRVFGNDGHKYYSMQDMNPTICNTTDKEHSSIQVVDERDGKVYWITKLKDGNCWMTQNLDFEISTDGTELFAATSDVESDRTLTAVAWDTDNDSIYYMDGGDDYYVNGVTKTAGYSNLPTNSKDRHYAAGDYYSWKAATAGQGTASITNADVTESICPKGWRLPTSNSYTENYSFGKLTDAYGITNNSNGSSDSALLSSPLLFVRGGYVYFGSPYSQGSLGYYWSSRAYSDTDYAYDLGFSSSHVYPNNGNYCYDGFSVRCVAHGNAISLTYNANGGTNAPSATIAESNSTSATITIPSTIPTRERYNFLGWATSSTATAPDYVYSNGSFTPSTITVTGNQTLYAVWEGPIFYMQDVLDWMDDLELEQQVQVVDSRDNKIYWVAKLKDGNIWMTQNLDYDLSVTSNQTLTPATSNVTATRTVTPVSWGSDYNSIYYKDGGDDYYANGTTKTAGYSNLPANSEDRHYAAGDYYSWKAATAGQGTTSITNADVNESICPKGWRLPTSNSDSADYSFGNLVKQYGYTGGFQVDTSDATLLASPLFFARGGYVHSGSLDNRVGSGGNYWSSRAGDDDRYIAHDLHFISSRMLPSYVDERSQGNSVRCVAL